LGIYLKEYKSTYKGDTYPPVLIAGLFTIAKTWNQPRGPQKQCLDKEMWYIYTMEYYSAITKNGIMLFAGKWTELEIMMLSEISQSQEEKCPMCFHSCEI
jgi:hypothetical protein